MQTCFIVMVGAPWEHHAVFSPREVHVGPGAEERANAAVAKLREDPQFTGFVFDAVEVVLVDTARENEHDLDRFVRKVREVTEEYDRTPDHVHGGGPYPGDCLRCKLADFMQATK